MFTPYIHIIIAEKSLFVINRSGKNKNFVIMNKIEHKQIDIINIDKIYKDSTILVKIPPNLSLKSELFNFIIFLQNLPEFLSDLYRYLLDKQSEIVYNEIVIKYNKN